MNRSPIRTFVVFYDGQLQIWSVRCSGCVRVSSIVESVCKVSSVRAISHAEFSAGDSLPHVYPLLIVSRSSIVGCGPESPAIDESSLGKDVIQTASGYPRLQAGGKRTLGPFVDGFMSVAPVHTDATTAVRCRPRTTRGGELAMIPTAMTWLSMGPHWPGHSPTRETNESSPGVSPVPSECGLEPTGDDRPNPMVGFHVLQAVEEVNSVSVIRLHSHHTRLYHSDLIRIFCIRLSRTYPYYKPL